MNKYYNKNKYSFHKNPVSKIQHIPNTISQNNINIPEPGYTIIYKKHG